LTLNGSYHADIEEFTATGRGALSTAEGDSFFHFFRAEGGGSSVLQDADRDLRARPSDAIQLAPN